MKSVEWLLKGQNNLTEMYSALKAEVEIPSDPATKLNVPLINDLAATSSKIIVCGQALSHCVNFTARDLLEGWPKDRASDIIVLSDCASPVPSFEDSGKKKFLTT